MLNSAYKRGDYDWLYANYLGEGHDVLTEAVVDHCQERKPQAALDLCAGTGHMTRLLIQSKIPRVVAVDKSSAMLAGIHAKITPIDSVFCGFESWILDLNETESFFALQRAFPNGVDLITCRQGIGYLRRWALVRIPQLLSVSGSFFFNSFIEPPSMQPWWHRRGEGIYETGFYLGQKRRVYHAQIRWPRIDFTHFEWHDVQGDLCDEWTRGGFHTEVTRYNRSLLVEVQGPSLH